MAVPRFWRELPVRYNLIGSHCTHCNMYHYPPRSMCSGCHRESIGKLEKYQFAGTGQVVACTVVYQPPVPQVLTNSLVFSNICSNESHR